MTETDNNSPKISVIVPVYNSEQYLPKCIDSILAQTFSDFELILVNDGSKDGSGDICDEYAQKDKRVRVYHKENGGVSSARNLGLDNAKGEWVYFVDSDDWIDPDCFRTVSDYFEKDIDIIRFGFRQINPDTKEIIEYKPKFFSKDYSITRFYNQDNFSRSPMSACLKFIRRNILHDNFITFPIDMKNNEDILFINMAICKANGFVTINQSFYNQLLTPNSASRSKITFKKLHDRLTLIDRFFEYIHQISLQDKDFMIKMGNSFLKGFFMSVQEIGHISKQEKQQIQTIYREFYKINKSNLNTLYSKVAYINVFIITKALNLKKLIS